MRIFFLKIWRLNRVECTRSGTWTRTAITGQGILSPSCLPIPPFEPTIFFVSGRRDSNPRPQPWQGCALPTELLPRYLLLDFRKLSYFRVVFFCFCSLPVFAFVLPRLWPFIFWGKVVLYQLSYFRVVATSAKYGCKDRWNFCSAQKEKRFIFEIFRSYALNHPKKFLLKLRR